LRVSSAFNAPQAGSLRYKLADEFFDC
jgi:hypothetical protein